MGIPRFCGDQITIDNVEELSVGANPGILPSTGVSNVHVAANAAIVTSKLAAIQQRRVVKSQVFDLDNGAGTTVDDVAIVPTSAITIQEANIVYCDAATGTVAGGSIKIGTAAGGTQIAAATNYENTKAVGTTTAIPIENGAVPAGTPVCVRHTGVAVTQAGKAFVQIEYTIDDPA